MKKIWFISNTILLGFIFISLAGLSYAGDNSLTFLPGEPLFAPLIADYREPTIGFTQHTSENEFEVNLGDTLEFLRWQSSPDMQWGFGVFAGTFFLFQNANLSGLEVLDWTTGFYFSEQTGPFSFRLEFQDQKSDLGDLYEYTQSEITFTRDNYNLTFSFDPSAQLRLFAGGGTKVFWDDFDPTESQVFAFCGTEMYSQTFPLFDTLCRVYGTSYFKYQDQAGGTYNEELQLGFQWKGDENKRRSLRLAAVYYQGHSPYGQFFTQPNDQYWGISLFIDP